MNQPLLQVVDLKKHFPIRRGLFRRQLGWVKAVDGISFEVNEGKVLGIVGESGSGKSTAARAAIRLIEPTGGQIEYRGEDLRGRSKRSLKRWRPKVQMVFQDPYASLNPRRTVLDNLGEPLLIHKRVSTRREAFHAVEEVLDQVGISPKMVLRYPHQFSGGQQQRLCIGRAIILHPELLICDEAVSALDVSVQAQILNLLADLKERLGLTLLFISHDLAVVRYFCDEVIVMYQGKIVERGLSEELFSNPSHSYTKELLAAIPCDHPRHRIRP